MHTKFCSQFASLILFALFANFANAQVGGSLMEFPPQELYLEIHEDDAGKPHLSEEQFRLVTGDLYRLHISSDGRTDWRIEMEELLLNAHLRVLDVNGIEIHLQSMVFRAIEFDEPGEIWMSFVPIRPGTYPFTVGRNPRAMGLPRGTANIQEADRSAEGRFIVE